MMKMPVSGNAVARGRLLPTVLPVVLAILTACAATPPPEPKFVTPADKKHDLLREMEVRIDALLVGARPLFDSIRREVEEKLDRLEIPMRLQVIDPVLTSYGEQEEQEFRDQIEEIVGGGKERTQHVIDTVSEQIRSEAYRLAGTDTETVAEFATGYDDLDQMVAAAEVRLTLLAAIPGLDDMGYFERGEAVRLPRAGKVDKEGVGRLSLFISPPLEGQVLKGQESQAVVVTFQPAQGAEPVGPIRLVQAVRHRILRGGVPVRDLGWRMDPNTPGGDGIIPLDPDVEAPGYVVSEISYPVINTSEAMFDQWRDYIFEAAFEAAAQRTDTGEFVAGVSWRLRWVATRSGKLLVEASPPPLPRTDQFVILERLMK